MKQIVYIYILLLLTFMAKAQAQSPILSGKVTAPDEHGHIEPLEAVNIHWLGTTIGAITNKKGEFDLPFPTSGVKNKIVVSFIGYRSDTIPVEPNEDYVSIQLTSGEDIAEVSVTFRQGGTYLSSLTPIKTEKITSEGLQRLACCNLSESFESNATVDVGFTDAVTGAKQIQMLGLAGTYSQMLTENIPGLRGLASPYGLTYIPGTWMESIQVSKGTASVINGYEAVTGQINLEFKKPEESEKLFINLYGNSNLRTELNMHTTAKISEHLGTMVFAHGSMLNNAMDENNDGFMELPLSRQLNFYNRWNYEKPGVLDAQFGLKYLYDEKTGGQTAFRRDVENIQNLYGIGIDTRNISAYAKLGRIIGDKEGQNLGLQLSASRHEQHAFYGNRLYDGNQNSFYSNLIFQSYFGNTNHKYSTGLSYAFDEFNETMNEDLFKRKESVPGAFFQYTLTFPERLVIIGGLRADHHNIFGMLYTLRGHLKYDVAEDLVVRASAGNGYHSPSVFAENTGYLASSRQFIFTEKIRIEKATNYGVNLTRKFHFNNKKEITWSADLYRTDFQNQLVVDADKNQGSLYFYNLKGESYSNSFQTDLIFNMVKGLEFTAAFRYNSVKITTDGILRDKVLVPSVKGVSTISYKTENGWQFDFTGQLIGKSRLPSTLSNKPEYQRPEESESYGIIHVQVTKRYKMIDFYGGVENLTGFVQKNPIIAADNPFSESFDASLVWGPLTGRMFYGGLRFTLF